jgi:hypothetical protein
MDFHVEHSRGVVVLLGSRISGPCTEFFFNRFILNYLIWTFTYLQSLNTLRTFQESLFSSSQIF